MTMGDAALGKPTHPFSCVDNVRGLAQMLGVPKDALFCVKMMQDTLCVVSGCTYSAACHNSASGRGVVQDVSTTKSI
jgi:hypothetical protein